MKNNQFVKKHEKWDSLVAFVSKNFGDGDILDLQAILFLIGINELGKGYKEFSKEDKINLVHIAICKLLSRYGYYKLLSRDKDGWPHYKELKPLQNLSDKDQLYLIKEAIIKYLE